MNEKEKEEFSATRQRLTTTEQELADLKQKYQRSEREKALFSLQSQGYAFDLAAELEDAGDMNEAAFGKHVERIKRFSQKAPIAQKFSVATVDGGGSTSRKNTGPSPAQIKAHAQAKGVSFEQAAAELQGA